MTDLPSIAGCVLFSEIAYLADGEATDRLGRMGFTGIKCFDDLGTDTSCFQARSEFFDLVGFKGTSSLTDMLIDAQIFQSTWFEARVHSGFLSAYGTVRDRIMAGMGVRPLIVVGHSLGGALATLFVSDLYHQGRFGPIKCVTFGCPRVGNDAFALNYNRTGIETIRVVHHDDIVPRIPNIGYSHVDGLLHLLDDGTATGDLRNWWRNLVGWNRMLKDEAHLALSDVDGEALEDHKLGNYAAVVNKYLTKELAHA